MRYKPENVEEKEGPSISKSSKVENQSQPRQILTEVPHAKNEGLEKVTEEEDHPEEDVSRQ